MVGCIYGRLRTDPYRGTVNCAADLRWFLQSKPFIAGLDISPEDAGPKWSNPEDILQTGDCPMSIYLTQDGLEFSPVRFFHRRDQHEAQLVPMSLAVAAANF